MPTRTIEIEDADQGRTYVLEVVYDRLMEEFELGLSDNLEVATVRCVEIRVSCGEQVLSIVPAMYQPIPQAFPVGCWCLKKYRCEITEALNAADLVLNEAA
jgi:hypothetical protein